MVWLYSYSSRLYYVSSFLLCLPYTAQRYTIPSRSRLLAIPAQPNFKSPGSVSVQSRCDDTAGYTPGSTHTKRPVSAGAVSDGGDSVDTVATPVYDTITTPVHHDRHSSASHGGLITPTFNTSKSARYVYIYNRTHALSYITLLFSLSLSLCIIYLSNLSVSYPYRTLFVSLLKAHIVVETGVPAWVLE